MQAPKITFKREGDEALQEAPIEEHFIIRFPIGIANTLREPIAKREVPFDLQLHWKDARHGKLSLGNKSLHATLVDLPCITESLKTIDNKQFYKIADVSQMVVVTESKYQGSKDYAWPDGLTYPLQNVRNNRFRKRMSKRIVEDVEQEVERLLAADLESEKVAYEVHDQRDGIESEEEEEESESETESQRVVEVGGAESEVGEEEDFDLEAAIDEAMDKEDEKSESENESGSEVESGDDDNELKRQAKVLKNEIQQLESKLHEKNMLVENQVNAIMKERFKTIVSKLAMELSLKKEQLLKVEQEILEEEEV